MTKNLKNKISEGLLGVAVAVGPFAAFICLASVYTNKPISDLVMNTFMGLFWLLIFLHFFFRDENFDKLQAINRVIWILSPWLVILFINAFILKAYLAMFVSLGLLILIYLIQLLKSFIESEKEDIG